MDYPMSFGLFPFLQLGQADQNLSVVLSEDSELFSLRRLPYVFWNWFQTNRLYW